MILNLVAFGHGSHESAWRAPGARATAPLELSHWITCARAAEKAGFDGLFLGDILCVQDRPEHHPCEALDPLMVLCAVAGATERLRLIGTASTSFNHPYHLARRILTLQHLSGGRAGWNIVTSSYPQEALNFGWPEMPPTDERYALAEDVVQAVEALWNGWDGIARLGDRQSGRWLAAPPPPIRRSGRFGSTEGPLNLSPEPYGRPLFAQAGSSPEGMAFAARHADQVFTVQSEIEGARRFRTTLRSEAAKAGRDMDDIRVLPGLVPFIGETEDEAENALGALTRHVALDHLLPKLERFTGLTLRGLELDARLPFRVADLPQNRFSNSRAHLLLADAEQRRLTLRQFAARFAAGRGHLLHVGTAEQLALLMRRWVAEEAADGFNVMPPLLPSGIAPFGDKVMPLLAP